MSMHWILLVVARGQSTAVVPRHCRCRWRKAAAAQPPCLLVLLLEDADYCFGLTLVAAGARGGLHCRTRLTEAVAIQNTLVSSLENERNFIKVKNQRWLHKDLMCTP
jgi:hypothetical protein